MAGSDSVGDEFNDLPPHIQAAIRRREAVTRRIHDAVDSLDLTWEIAGGNLAELDRAILAWEGDKWRTLHQNRPAKHQYHRRLLRLFPNFLSSAVSAVWHAERIAARLENVAPELSAQFDARLTRLQASEDHRLLDCLRDYAIHTGHHSTVLVLQGVQTEAGEMRVSATRPALSLQASLPLGGHSCRRPGNTRCVVWTRDVNCPRDYGTVCRSRSTHVDAPRDGERVRWGVPMDRPRGFARSGNDLHRHEHGGCRPGVAA
jgi:hypothetical protein